MENTSELYCPKIKINFDHTETAFSAIKKILKELLLIMQKNEAGIIKGLNGEFLHDYRVATRKARSILTQVKKIYNKSLTKNFNNEFKAIAGTTNLLRDLEVFLIDKQFYLDLLNKPNNSFLDEFFLKLEEQRKLSCTNVIKNINSSKYKIFITQLNNFLITDTEEQKNINSDLSIRLMVNKQINKRYNKIIKIGNKIQVSTTSKKFHKLRIQFKKLRYLVELFSSLYSKSNLFIFIEQLKKIQDHLGKINDYSTQHSIVTQYLITSDNEFCKSLNDKEILLDLIKIIENEQKSEIILFLNIFKKFTKLEV